MKKLVWFRALVVVAVAVVLLVGAAAVFPHFHSDIGGKEQDGCSTCFLHQTIQPLTAPLFTPALAPWIKGRAPTAVASVFLSQYAGCWFDSRAPPALL